MNPEQRLWHEREDCRAGFARHSKSAIAIGFADRLPDRLGSDRRVIAHPAGFSCVRRNETSEARRRDYQYGLDPIATAKISSSGLRLYEGGLLNFTKGLAELAIQEGIRVNAVVWTPLIPSTMPPEKARDFGKDTAFCRAAQPAELAPAYVFLASNEASYITGELLGATGGKTPL